jgi:hypothetical protein
VEELDGRPGVDVTAAEFAALFESVQSWACEAAARWEFLCMTAPLRIVGGTGSPVNPLAIL